MTPTVYLVSGASRGIGLGLVRQLAARDDVIVFAGARSPSGANDLHTLEAKYPGKVHTVQLTSSNKSDNEAAIGRIKATAGRLDVVIANAGIGNFFKPSLEVTAEAMREHYEVNVIGTLVLFQAAYSLLKASTDSSKFLIISSTVGSISRATQIPVPLLPYGASKAALNWLACKLYFEYPELITLPIEPGGVATDGSAAAREANPIMAKFPAISVEESVVGLLKIVDAAKREEGGPKLIRYDGSIVPW